MNNIFRKSRMVVVAALFLGTVVSGHGQNLTKNLSDLRVSIDVRQKSLGYVISHLVNEYSVPIGFEESTFDREHNDYYFTTLYPDRSSRVIRYADGNPAIAIDLLTEYVTENHKFDLKFRAVKLSDVMDSIVKQMKHYKWGVVDEVINIFPVKGRDKRFEELLNLHVKKFNVSPTYQNGMLKFKILRVPELLEFCEQHVLQVRTVRDSGPDEAAKQKAFGTSLELNDVSLRKILNSVTKIKGGGWILRMHSKTGPSGQEYIDIEI